MKTQKIVFLEKHSCTCTGELDELSMKEADDLVSWTTDVILGDGEKLQHLSYIKQMNYSWRFAKSYFTIYIFLARLKKLFKIDSKQRQTAELTPFWPSEEKI